MNVQHSLVLEKIKTPFIRFEICCIFYSKAKYIYEWIVCLDIAMCNCYFRYCKSFTL